MTITTEEAERLARNNCFGQPTVATVLRSLAAERDDLEKTALQAAHCHVRETARADKLQAENDRLREVLRAFPGFVDDATIGDEWIERKNAALGGEGNG
jgi:hypothetical protein